MIVNAIYYYFRDKNNFIGNFYLIEGAYYGYIFYESRILSCLGCYSFIQFDRPVKLEVRGKKLTPERPPAKAKQAGYLYPAPE